MKAGQRERKKVDVPVTEPWTIMLKYMKYEMNCARVKFYPARRPTIIGPPTPFSKVYP